MNIVKEDFKLITVDKTDGHEDYWFETSSNADEELSREYMEQGLQHVFEVVYSKDEDFVGVKRQFIFNWDVVISDDEHLKSVLKELAVE